jgi:superfamily II DNA or RNA helicase
MPTTTLRIIDQVNCKFVDLDPFVRKKIVDALKFFIPYARHTPAFKLGRWDGMAAYATAGGGTFINLLDRVLPIVMEAGYEIVIDDKRPVFEVDLPPITEKCFAGHVWPVGHPNQGEEIELRDYQVIAANAFFQNPQSIQELATGAGKSLLTAAISKAVEPHGRSLLIVPSKSLVVQSSETYIDCGLDTGIYFGDHKDTKNKHIVATWQSLEALSKKAKTDQAAAATLAEILDGMICVICDEVHQAKANILKALLTGSLAFIPLRAGFSGTLPREEFDYLSLYASIGPQVGGIKAAELQERGVLANCEIEMIQTIDDHVNFNDYHDEHDWLTSNKERLNWLASYCMELSKNGNTLVLVNKIDTGKYLQSISPGSNFIFGGTKLAKRQEEYTEFRDADNKLLYAGSGIASTGISITRIKYLVLFECGKSHSKVIQSIGRSLRKGFDKDHAYIKDVFSTAKYSKKHGAKRKTFYKDAEYPFTVVKLNYIK